MSYRCIDVKLNLLDKPDVLKYEFETWNSLIAFLRKSINSSNHFVYVSKISKEFITKFRNLRRTTQTFSYCVTCYESLNDDLENLWINSKYGNYEKDN